MAVVKISFTTGGSGSVNSENIVRIYERGSYRDIYLTTGSVGSSGSTILSVKNTLASLITAAGNLKGLTELNNNRAFAINSAFVSRVLDETGTYRNVWFGPGSLVGVSSDVVSVKETSVAIYNLTGLPKVTDYNTNRTYLMNPSYVSRVDNSGSWRSIWTGTGNTPTADTSLTSVKETVAQLRNLGIG